MQVCGFDFMGVFWVLGEAIADREIKKVNKCTTLMSDKVLETFEKVSFYCIVNELSDIIVR
jgi:hypothetical protein